jgi:hypothetical protein
MCPVPGVTSVDRVIDRCRLPDGTPVRLRAVVGTDRQMLQDMYAALSQVSRVPPRWRRWR